MHQVFEIAVGDVRSMTDFGQVIRLIGKSNKGFFKKNALKTRKKHKNTECSRYNNRG